MLVCGKGVLCGGGLESGDGGVNGSESFNCSGVKIGSGSCVLGERS